MVDVTLKNFDDICPDIITSVYSCDFIALDCEFTGLHFVANDKPSLFDNGAERYRKLRNTSSRMTISQLGLSLFQKEADTNRYVSHTYNIYLFPHALGSLNRTFTCQASSLQFLCKHNFDFNKFFYDGVSFLNEEDELIVENIVTNQTMFHGLDRDLDEEALQECCSRVARWLVNAEVGSEVILENIPDVSEYVLHTELCMRFNDIWPEVQGTQLKIARVTPEKQQQLKIQSESEQRITQRMLGFSRIFKEMVKAKKPLVGHNMFMDLMLIYDKFYRPLPDSYELFKETINLLFPTIYDTKHISSCLRQPLQDLGYLDITNLGELHKQLSNETSRMRYLYSPGIVLAPGCEKYENNFLVHEAGYDSFICGCVFLRIAHIAASREISSEKAKPFVFQQYLQVFAPFLNCVNLIRGTSNHIILSGDDPASRRAQPLFIRSRTGCPLNKEQLVQRLSSYGSVDIQLFDSRRALVAVGNHRCAQQILRACYKDENLVVTRYVAWKHHPLINSALRTALLVSGGLCLWTIFSAIKIIPSTH